MKALLNLAREWFLALAPRERWMVAVGGIVTTLILFFLLVWEPIVLAHERRAQALGEARALAQRLEQVAADSRGGAPRAAVNRSQSLLAAVDTAGKSPTLGKAPSRLQPEGENEVRVWFEDVPFDKLVRWISQLETRYGLRISAAEFERRAGAGLVNARLTVTRP